jgi:hypothetical protein
MDKYTAVKPVRFDRTYAVGEVIPGEVIDKRSARRLIEAGKIAPAPADTPPDIQGDTKEDILVFLEDILGIDHGDQEPPELGARADLCKEVIVELKNAAAALADRDDGQEGGDGDREPPMTNMMGMPIDEELLSSLENRFGVIPAEAGTPLEERRKRLLAAITWDKLYDGTAPKGAESPQSDDRGDGDTQTPAAPENAVEATQGGTGTHEQSAGSNPGDAQTGLPDMTCPVCGKICGSKGALTSHMKMHKTE